MVIIKHKCRNGILLACTLVFASISATFGLLASTIGHALGAISVTGTWFVTPGGPVTGSSQQPTLKDAKTGATWSCVSSATAATLQKGSGLINPIGKITSLTFTSCAGPLGMVFTVATSASSANPWPLTALSFDPSTGVTNGEITKVVASISGANCNALLSGTSASSPGEVTGNFANGASTLTVGGGNLHAWDVSGCLGFLNNGDAVSFSSVYNITPPQTVMGL